MAFFRQPGVHSLTAEPDIVEGECAKTELGDEHGTSVVKALDHDGVLRWDAVPERLCAVGGGNSRSVQQIFGAPGDAVKRAPVLASGDFGVGLFRQREREITRKGDDRAKFGIELFDPIEIDMRKALGSKFALLDPV